MSLDVRSFGRRLREERERRGVTLPAIADSTKIKASLLAGLERGDLSHWPRGIYRRSFFREYASAIGLRGDGILHEFLQLFPESGTADPPTQAVDPAGSLRLTLASEPARTSRRQFAQALVAAAELGAVVGVAAVFTMFVGKPFWNVCGLAGLGYYAVAAAVIGQSPGAWWLNGRAAYHLAQQASRGTKAAPALKLVSRRADSTSQGQSLRASSG
jgi:transcriptional regulator with XRE-family HTH domain